MMKTKPTKTLNLDSLVRPNVEKMEPYTSARDEFSGSRDTMIFLDANENPFDNGVNRYPDPYQLKLKSLISDIKQIPIKNILLGNGSDEVLDLIFRAFCIPGTDSIITLPPTYGMYSVLANLNALSITEVLLDSEFQPKVNDIIKVQNDTSKLLVLCSPNNPTGTSFDSKKVKQLITNFNGIVIIDEAYIEFSKYDSWIYRLNEFPNLIVTQTLSKAYGLAGIRLGLCFASEAIISVLNRIKPPYNINELTQSKAYAELKNSQKILDHMSTILEEREWLTQQLKTIPFIEKVYPSDANFLLIKVDNANLRYNQLLNQNIVVRNRTKEALCNNCLRCSVGTPEENQKLISTLKNLT